MPSHARTVTRTTHRVRNALLVVLLLLVVCAAAAGFSGFKLYKSAMSAKAHLNNVVNAAKVIKDGSIPFKGNRCAYGKYCRQSNVGSQP